MGFKRNTNMVLDLLGEGEITLVNGLASIYLNKTPIANSNIQHTLMNKLFNGSVSGTAVTFPGSDIYRLDAYRPIRIQKGGALGSVTTTAGVATVTTAAAFFTSPMIASSTPAGGGLYQYIRIPGAGPAGSDYVGEVTAVADSTHATLYPTPQTAVSGAEITFDHFSFGVMSATGATLDTACPRTGTFLVDIGSASLELGQPDASALNFKFVRVSYRSGTLHQPPLKNMGGFTDASFGRVIGTELKQHSDYWNLKLNNRSNVTSNIGTSGTSIDIDSGTDLPATADKIVVTISAAGLEVTKPTTGDKEGTGLTIQIWFDYKTGAGDWASELMFGPTDRQLENSISYSWDHLVNPVASGTSGDIKGHDPEASDFEFAFDIDQFKPFTQFKIRIKRVTPVNYRLGTWEYTNSTVVKSVQGFINDKLNYTLSAYAAIMYDSNEFEGNAPSRGYHCYGIPCWVPTNYITRLEASEETVAGSFIVGKEYTIKTVGSTSFTTIGATSNTVGVVFTATGVGSGSGVATGSAIARYTRDISTGEDTGVYVPWDGTFRKVYCDNPAWVLRTLLLENRFGLGNWIKSEHISSYSFYSMARRCDELVPDGDGGLEPRFICGVYLTQATEAYKIIKDFCSIMLSVPFWLDGLLNLEGDRPQEPIYTFSKGNIIGGMFAYENTGNKTRPNQIAVTFNDKNNFYSPTVELVDDVEDMVIKNRVFSEEAVAFGAVTRSQAIRYAKWKLLTSKMNKEIVSFKTAENAGYIRPGNVVMLQDADRDRIRNSGRIASATLSSVTLDKAITLYSGTYQVHVMVPGPATYLSQASATIGGTEYSQGDMLPIYTEAEAQDLIDDDGEIVNVTWSPDMHLETRTVTTGAGTGITTLNVSANFSEVPGVEFMWALTQTISGAEVAGSGKLYRVLGISEESTGIYNITASEHFNEKFDELDETYLSEVTELVSNVDEIPLITNFTATVAPRNNAVSQDNSTSNIVAIDIALRWTPPKSVAVNSTQIVYPNLDRYLIQYHTITGELKNIIVSKSATTFTVENLPYGVYEFNIQAFNIAGASTTPIYTTASIRSDSDVSGVVNQIGLPRGGRFTVAPILEGNTIIAPNNYSFTSPAGTTVTIVDGDLA